MVPGDEGAPTLQEDAAKTPPAQSHSLATPAASLSRASDATLPERPAQPLGTQRDGDGARRPLPSIRQITGATSNTRNQNSHGPPTNQVTQEWQVVSNKSRDQGKRRKTDTASEFACIIACFSEIAGMNSGIASFREPEVAQLIAEASNFLKQCKSRAKELKTRRPTRGLPFAESGLAFPYRDTVDVKVAMYFAAFESTHRILHIPSFWRDYRAFWDDPEGVSTDLRLKVLLVMSIGSSVYDHGSTDATLRNTELAHQCIYDAETWLSGPLEKDRICITGLQISCLTILARQIFSIGGDTVWVTMGSLIHAAMQLGLHRDPEHLTLEISCLEAEVRRRLWATILDLAVQASLDSAMPPRISMNDFDTQPPANINDDEIDESTKEVVPSPRGDPTSTFVQITLLESLPVRLRIVQQLNSLHSELNYTATLALSRQLTEAVRSAHNATYGLPGVTAFHRSILDYLIRRFLIPLHYSFSNRARADSMFSYSLTLSAETAVALLRPAETDESHVFFARLMALGGGLFRAGVRGALTALTLDLLTRVQEQRLDGTLEKHAQHRAPATRAVRDLVALSDRRIRLGETNVKGYMFLCMILAQVEAVEDDDDARVEERVARAARDSLEHCLGLLKARGGGIRRWRRRLDISSGA
ncbi:hypothetical protein PG999_012307 [Apiospora kogelbergensis]|uniref:Xylanolytic transcriptional activator regulatory domain-containing protein n=1 Tax=Apiospora kogelbergensis TaxID=1337665 RepID=A0AAW0QL37_9PEZI